MNLAGDLDAFQAAFRQENGIPWVNTMAADSSSRAWYIDASRTPKLSDEAEARLREHLVDDPLTALLFANRVALLDGSDPLFEWADTEGAPGPWLVPFDELPQLERRDWVANANESHWMVNPAHALTGYSVLHGIEDTPCSVRTRANFAALSEAGSGAGGMLTARDLETRVLSNRSVTAALLRAPLAERCAEAGSVEVAGRTVDLAPAAAALGAWDGHFDLGSLGAHLWREIMVGLPVEAVRDAGMLWSEGFDPTDPVGRPCGLAPASLVGTDPLLGAVARAVLALGDAGVALDAPLGEIQWAQRGDARCGVHGGQERDGAANILGPIGMLPSHSLEPQRAQAMPVAGRTELTGLRAGGYEVTYGTAWLLVVEFTADGPRARSLLPYGQFGDVDSPPALEQLEAYAAKALRPVRFTDADIDDDPNLESVTIRSTA
jgi:acyl-homoserine-lactone acylase